MYLEDGRYEKELERLEKDPNIHSKDKEIIRKIGRETVLIGLSKLRSYFYLLRLRIICSKYAQKPLHLMSKDDIKELVFTIESNGYTDRTKKDMKTSIKKFFQILDGYEWFSKEYPDRVKWIKTYCRRGHKLPKELLTKEEVDRMIDHCKNTRDRALIHILYESGCRIGEIYKIKLNDIEFDEYGAILIVNGKTGMRRVRLVKSVNDLKNWLSTHPKNTKTFRITKYNSDSLWVSINYENMGKQLTYGAIKDLIKKLAKKSGIRKRIYPHLFRHSRATHLANHLTEAQMKEYFGWTQGSDMASVYVHLSGRDIDQAILKLNGIFINNTSHSQT